MPGDGRSWNVGSGRSWESAGGGPVAGTLMLGESICVRKLEEGGCGGFRNLGEKGYKRRDFFRLLFFVQQRQKHVAMKFCTQESS